MPNNQNDSTEPKRTVEWRVAGYPDRNPGNPHIELFYDALRPHGIRLVDRLRFDTSWLASNADELDVIHIHWPERIWRGRVGGRLERIWRAISLRQARSVMRLRRFLRLAGRLGLKRIWTVHNVEHHEGSTWVDRWGYRVLYRESDLLIVYGESGAAAIRNQQPSAKNILVMRHGNYQDAYPQPRSREEAIQELGLDPKLPLVSCVGIIRRQKGFDIACDAAGHLAGKVQLVIAGKPHSTVDVPALTHQISGISGAVAIPRELTEQEFADIVAASDVVLLPYRQVTGSGVLYAAWTLGRGVVASDLPFFQEMLVDHPLAGRLFRTGDAAEMARAIQQYLDVPAEQRVQAAMARAEDFSWDRCVEPLVEIFRRWDSHRQTTPTAPQHA